MSLRDEQEVRGRRELAMYVLGGGPPLSPVGYLQIWLATFCIAQGRSVFESDILTIAEGTLHERGGALEFSAPDVPVSEWEGASSALAIMLHTNNYLYAAIGALAVWYDTVTADGDSVWYRVDAIGALAVWYDTVTREPQA